MRPTVHSIVEKLKKARNNQFVLAEETESFKIACQKIDGEHSFKHLNLNHDEILFLISGELKIWTDEGEFNLKEGGMLKIPKNVEHGELIGKDAKILIMEGKL